MKTSFEVIIYKVQTMKDGGIRITLDASEDAVSQMQNLLSMKDEVIHAAFITQDEITD